MINLLPQLEKKKILGAYRLRLGVIILCGIFVLFVFAAALLAPSYLLVTANTKNLAIELDAKKANAPTGEDGAQGELARIKEEIARLKIPESSELTASLLLGLILAQKPLGIDISSYAYANSDPTIAVQLSGVAATREDLLAFQRNLQTDPRFADVKYAQSFIIQKTDISFQLTITIK